MTPLVTPRVTRRSVARKIHIVSWHMEERVTIMLIRARRRALVAKGVPVLSSCSSPSRIG
jgi:hypothetical protein